KLQKDSERLQKQLKELTPEQDPEKPAPKSAKEDSDPEGMKESLRAAGVLFRRHCQRCHGTDGKGVAGKLDSPDPPDFTRRAWQDEQSNARLLKSILGGKKPGMPAFGKDLNEDQARDLVDYIRAFTPPRRANSTKPDKDPGDRPCRRKDQERCVPSERARQEMGGSIGAVPAPQDPSQSSVPGCRDLPEATPRWPTTWTGQHRPCMSKTL